jgi:hypothetical protein
MADQLNRIEKNATYRYRFSVGTLLTNEAEYAEMQQSFVQRGFGSDCEYLVADNSRGNQLDAYEAIRRFLQEADAEYVILVHQDVRCADDRSVLEAKLEELNRLDANWAVAGNAGGIGYKQFVHYLDNNGKVKKDPRVPIAVRSLDENLLIVKNGKGITVSADIGDFHFYGTDICQVAHFLGYTCYVIGFMVQHLSSGNLEKMYARQPSFIEAYGRKLQHRFVQTTCTKFYLSHSPARNRFFNGSFVFFWVKAAQRVKNLFRKN